jgi:enoyl-CoA hydratase
MEPTVRVEKLGPVTLVTLDRPEVRNAVDSTTARALYEVFAGFEADQQARVAVFHGAHGHFCAGWDLQAGARLAREPGAAGLLHGLDFTPSEARPAGHDAPPGPLGASGNATGPIGPMGPTRLLLSKPVIAAVSGAAVAGGMELALWCDMRVMEEDAYFGVYCRRFGVPLIDGGTVRLPRLIGMGHALDLILTGRKVEAAEALQMGLANRVVPAGAAREAAVALARQLATFPQATMLSDRMNAYEQWDLSLPEALHLEWERSKHRIPDALEGAARFAGGEGRHGKF